MGAKIIGPEEIESASSVLWEEIGDGLSQNLPPESLRHIIIKILAAAGCMVEGLSPLESDESLPKDQPRSVQPPEFP
jgi:hypothetical protein